MVGGAPGAVVPVRAVLRAVAFGLGCRFSRCTQTLVRTAPYARGQPLPNSPPTQGGAASSGGGSGGHLASWEPADPPVRCADSPLHRGAFPEWRPTCVTGDVTERQTKYAAIRNACYSSLTGEQICGTTPSTPTPSRPPPTNPSKGFQNPTTPNHPDQIGRPPKSPTKPSATFTPPKRPPRRGSALEQPLRRGSPSNSPPTQGGKSAQRTGGRPAPNLRDARPTPRR